MKRLFIALLLIPLSTFAQVRIEGGLQITSLKQVGVVYVPDVTSQPNIYQFRYVCRNLYHFGITGKVYVPIIPRSSDDKNFSLGIQSGLNYSFSRRNASVDTTYKLVGAENYKGFPGIVGMPFLLTLRSSRLMGKLSASEGAMLGAGVEAMFINTADERSSALLPLINLGLGVGRTSAYFNIYPVMFISYYTDSNRRTERLKNKFFSIHLTYVFKE